MLETLLSYFGRSSENEIYGIRRIFCEYAGVDSNSLIFARIQHGWVSSNIQRTLIKNDLVETFVWNQESRNHCAALGLKRVIPIGSPWLYMLEIARRLGWPVSKSSNSERKIDELWIYGAHSTKIQTGDLDSQLLDFLDAANKSDRKTVHVMLFYVDFFLVEEYVKVKYPNLTVFTSLGGRLHSSSADSHLFNLFWILNNSKRVVLDVPTTALLYAITMGCDVSWHKNKNYDSILRDSIQRDDSNLVSLLTITGETTQTIIDIANRELGLESFKSPEEIRALFRWKSDANFSFFNYFVTLKYLFTLPYKVRSVRSR
jgi:hypothetical protein